MHASFDTGSKSYCGVFGACRCRGARSLLGKLVQGALCFTHLDAPLGSNSATTVSNRVGLRGDASAGAELVCVAYILWTRLVPGCGRIVGASASMLSLWNL